MIRFAFHNHRRILSCQRRGRIPTSYVAMMISATTLLLIIGVVALFSSQGKPRQPPPGAKTDQREPPTAAQKRAVPSREDGASSPDDAAAARLIADDPDALDGVGLAEPSQNAARETPIADDEKTQWASPTGGEAIDLAYLPPGAEVILMLRLSEIVASTDGDKLLAAFGPWGEAQLALLEQASGTAAANIDQLVVGVRAERGETLSIFGVARLLEPLTTVDIDAQFADWSVDEHQGEKFLTSAGRAAYLPSSAGDVVVFGSVETVREAIESRGAVPGLRREMESVWADSDAARHINLLAAPNFVERDGRVLVGGAAEPLKELVPWFFGESAEAALLSAHLGEAFFVELRTAGSLSERPAALGEHLADRLSATPDRAEAFVVSLNPQPYGRRVLFRLPQMVKLLDRYTRRSIEGRQVVMRCYLPGAAAHNLLFALELALAEQSSTGAAAVATAPPTPAPATLADKLQKRITITFDQDTLESAVQMVAEAIGAEIEIAGGDLQLEGITKNQSFALDVRDQPAADVLLSIVRLANPDKTAESATDAAQKLVYVIRPGPAGTKGKVIVTTRAQATARKEALPAAFVKSE